MIVGKRVFMFSLSLCGFMRYNPEEENADPICPQIPFPKEGYPRSGDIA